MTWLAAWREPLSVHHSWGWRALLCQSQSCSLPTGDPLMDVAATLFLPLVVWSGRGGGREGAAQRIHDGGLPAIGSRRKDHETLKKWGGDETARHLLSHPSVSPPLRGPLPLVNTSAMCHHTFASSPLISCLPFRCESLIRNVIVS